MNGHLKLRRLASATALALASAGAQATEGGGLGVYPDGLENFMSGALPPPGVHMLVYAGGARYDTLRGNDGQRVPVPGFKVDVNVLAPRLIWVTQQQVVGGQLAFHAIAPLLDVTAKAAGQRNRSTGLGDMTLGVALGYHPSESLHYVVGLDMYAPTGEYDRKDPSSLGKNYWTAQPVFALSRISPDGFNADLKVMYDFNFTNSATDTRSGQALHADYALGWGVGKGWVLGVGGYAFQQVTDDSGPNSAAGRARAFGVGPSVRYMNEKGWLFTAKWQQDFKVKNRPEGAQLYVKLGIPF
ncbi:SphA family protein [Achromobacter anxifer]